VSHSSAGKHRTDQSRCVTQCQLTIGLLNSYMYFAMLLANFGTDV